MTRTPCHSGARRHSLQIRQVNPPPLPRRRSQRAVRLRSRNGAGATRLAQSRDAVRSAPLAWRRELQQPQAKAPALVIMTWSSEIARIELGAATSTAWCDTTTRTDRY